MMASDENGVILFVVEGPADQTALALIFDKLFAEANVRFDAVHSDITTMAFYDERLRGKSAIDLLREFVIAHVMQPKNRYNWSDLEKVVYLADTDGAFVDDSLVIEDEVEEISYSEENIICKDADHIRRRNKHKSIELKKLRSKSALTYNKKGVDLEVYYVSRNLEHALHGEAGSLSDDEKRERAYEFQNAYVNDLPGFIALLSDPEIAVPGDRAATWQFIESDARSLERWSNLHLVLPRE